MKLFENEISEYNIAYTSMKIHNRIIVLPKIIKCTDFDSTEWKKTLNADLKIECAINNYLFDLDNVYQTFHDMDYKKLNYREIEEMLMDTICLYANFLVTGCTDAGINILNILFPICYEKSEFNEILTTQNFEQLKREYEDTINILLALGHYSGSYFEALHLMCSNSEQDRSRGDNLMYRLIENDNPLAKKRKEIIHQLGYTDFDD